MACKTLFKLAKLGFGGKTLSLIQSMYRNDSIRFLINGQYSDPLWLTQGVKQGISYSMHPNHSQNFYFFRMQLITVTLLFIHK